MPLDDCPREDCPREDCPLPHLDESTRARVAALPAPVHQAIAVAWCANSHIPTGAECAAALAWHLANHDRRGSNKRSNTERGGKDSRVVQVPTEPVS